MKKYFVLLTAALLALAACEKTAPLEEPQPKAPTQLVVDFTPAYDAAPDTKAVKKGWEDGDVVYIFFQDVANGYLRMSYNAGAWSTDVKETNPGDVAAGLESGNVLTAVFLPFNSADAAPVFDTAENMWRFTNSAYAYYMFAGPVAYTVEASGDVATLSLSGGGPLELVVPDGFVQFFIKDDAAENGKAALNVTGMMPCGVDVVDVMGSRGDPGDQYGKYLPFDAALPGYVYGSGEEKGYLFSGLLASSMLNDFADYEFRLTDGLSSKVAKATNKMLNSSGKEHRAANITGLTWADDVLEAVPMYKDTDGNVYYFASMNLGAMAATDYGAYFAWGEVEKNIPSGNTFSRNFDWDEYKWGNSEDHLIKYCTTDKPSSWAGSGAPDNKTVLEPDDDAAVVWLGGGWRMPTDAEWRGLFNKCGWTWTTVSGVNGCLVKGKGEYKDNQIFLPAAGLGEDTRLGFAGDYGCYWSSTLHADYPHVACYLDFDDVEQYVFGYSREYGLPVRPLQKVAPQPQP